jgi:hypothetical protein
MPPPERLSQLVPPPATVARDRPWDRTEGRLGRRLPQDYKELIGTYGGGEFDGYIGLLVPPPVRNGSEIAEYNDDRMDELAGLWAIADNRPAELADDDLVLVAWADTIDSDTLNWLVRPGQPAEKWPIAVLDADLGQCEIYDMVCTDFLAGLLSGEIDSPVLSHQLSPGPRTFRPYPNPSAA